jgi:hypothetical protein
MQVAAVSKKNPTKGCSRSSSQQAGASAENAPTRSRACDAEQVLAFVQRTTASCGVAELVDDVAVLDTVARLVRP